MEKFSKCWWLLHGSHLEVYILLKRWMCLGGQHGRMCLDRRWNPSEQGGEFFSGGWPQQRGCIGRILNSKLTDCPFSGHTKHNQRNGLATDYACFQVHVTEAPHSVLPREVAHKKRTVWLLTAWVRFRGVLDQLCRRTGTLVTRSYLVR